METMNAGGVEIRIYSEPDTGHDDAAGNGTAAAGTAEAAAADEAVRIALEARRNGRRVVFWLMAAPSAFGFYDAFVRRAGAESDVAALARDAEWFQFDDYPIPRTSPRFPVTFRHLLEVRFFRPLADAIGEGGPARPTPFPGRVHFLELTGDERADQRCIEAYSNELNEALNDAEACVIQVKGIGMDGHWGFHGSETPLEAPPGFVAVEMNSANRRQQTLDWPEYFPREDDVPRYAVTATVSLFLRAEYIIDIVPQAAKEYAVLACYGTDRIHPGVPSSALKGHSRAVSFLTAEASRALREFRSARKEDSRGKLPEDSLRRLEGYWMDGSQTGTGEANIQMMRRVLEDLDII